MRKNQGVQPASSRQRSGTEFGGVSTASTVQPKATSALTSGDKLRLGYRTGQELDPTAPVTRRSWQGLDEPPRSVVDDVE